MDQSHGCHTDTLLSEICGQTRYEAEAGELTQIVMIIGIKILGRRRLSKICVRGSNREYETKKIDKHALY